MNEINTNLNNYISLAEASRLTSYNQDYLGSLCREGKLKGTKIGRNWVTTKEAVNDLLKTMGTSVPVAIPVKVITESFTPNYNSLQSNDELESQVQSLPIAIRTTSSGKPLNHISNVKQKTRDSFVLPSLNKKAQTKTPTAALIFASFVILFGLATLNGKNLLVDFFGHSKFNNFTYNIILNSNQVSHLEDGRVASEINRHSNSGIVLGTTINSKTKIQSISEADLSKLILTNLENLGSSGWFNKYIDNTLPSQVQPPYQQTQLPLNPPAPISYFQSPSQPFNGGSILGVTDLSSHRFITDDATISDQLTVSGSQTIGGNLDVTGTITAGSITGTINLGLTTGSVLFQGASNISQDNSNLFYDDTDNVFGIGTSTPTAKLTINGSASTGTGTITSSSGVNVTGTGTAFLTEVEVGDEITVNGQSRIVATVSSNTALTTTVAFNPVISSTPKVLVISSTGSSTPAAPASVSTLSWNHYIEGSIGSRLLMVSVMSSTSTPTVTSVTFGGTAMTLSGSNATSDSRHRLSNYYLVDPPAGVGSVVVTMNSNAVIVGESVLLANTARPTPITSGAAGGSSGAPDMIGLVFSSVAASDLAIASFVTDGSITATLDTSFNPATQVLNTTTGSTTSNPRALVGYAYGTGGFTYVYFLGSANNTHRYSVSKVRVGTETMGVFRVRTPLLSVVDSSSTSQIKIEAGGLANFHSGINVDLSGDGVTPTVALFNGGFVGIGTTAPTNDLSVAGDADFSGSLGVAGGTVDANIGINIQSTAAYGGTGVNRYGVSANLTATDVSNTIAGNFQAGSTFATVGADHNIVVGVDAGADFSGVGRVDNAIGVDVLVSNSNTGNINDSYGVNTQILNIGDPLLSNGGQINTARAYYADIVNSSNTSNILTGYAFHGKFRGLGTASFGTIYGLNLSGWSNAGSAITNSYGIYMDTSIDIGTTKYALWSSSTSQSYLQGALGIGDATPDASLEVVNDGSGDSFLVADTNDGDSTPFVIKSDGKVGIGTTTPSFAKLHINSTTNNLDAIALSTSSTANSGFFISLINNDVYIDQSETAKMIFSTNDEERVVIDADGNVGIGDLAPDASLEVVNDGSGDSFLVADTNDGDSTPFVIDSSGKVGIGVATPGAKLETQSISNQIGILISQTTAAITTAGNSLLKVTSNQADTSDQLALFENTVTSANYGNGGTNSGMVRILNASTSTGGTTTTNPNVAGLFIQTVDLDTISLLVRNNNSGTITMQNVGTAGAQGDPGVLTVEGLGDTTNVYNLITAYNSTTRSDAAAVFRVQADGNVYGEAAFNASGADYAEYFETTDTSIIGGEVVVADKTLGYKEKIVKSSKAYDANLLGIVSTNPAFVGNNAGGGNDNKDNYKLVALVGRVPVKVTNENGNIKIGDYLTSSEQFPGYAMKATQPGMVIGKALEAFDGDGVNSAGGQVLVFINMHTYTPMVADVLQGIDPLYSDLSDLNLLDSNLFNKIVVHDSLYVQGTIYVKGKAIIQELQVGSSSKPSGITLYDDDSGQPYCVKIKGGQWVQAQGTCETATNFQSNSMPISPRDPSPVDPVIDSTSPNLDPEPTAENIDSSPAL